MKLRVAFLSAVSGGPVDRLVDHLNASGRVEASVRSFFTTIKWREWRGMGGLRSFTARLLIMLAYPWYALLGIHRTDVLVTTTNPFWLPVFALITKKIHRRTIITLVYDVYPDSLGPTRFPRTLIHFMHQINHFWMHRSDAVVFISEGMSDELRRRYGDPRRHSVIFTGVDPSEFDNPAAQSDLHEWSDGLTMISYVGNAGHVHEVETVSKVLRGILRELPGDVGVFVSASGERAPALRGALGGETNVRFEGALEDDRWAWVQARSDIAVVSLNEGSTFSSMPSKYFSALGAGCAVFVVAPRTSDIYRLTESHHVGVAIEPGQSAEGVIELASLVTSPRDLESMQTQAQRVAKQYFSLTVMREAWLELLKEIYE